MGSGVKGQALNNSGTAQGMSSSLYGNSNQLLGTLTPQLEAEAASPTGYTGTEKDAMNTAAQQTQGGSNAGAVGQGALLAGRTRNAGTADAAIAQSNRNASKNLSDAAVNTEVQDANLKNQNQQAGLRGLQGLYGTELGGSQQALNSSNQALNVANGAKPSFWQQLGNSAVSGAMRGLTGGV